MYEVDGLVATAVTIICMQFHLNISDVVLALLLERPIVGKYIKLTLILTCFLLESSRDFEARNRFPGVTCVIFTYEHYFEWIIFKSITRGCVYIYPIGLAIPEKGNPQEILLLINLTITFSI